MARVQLCLRLLLALWLLVVVTGDPATDSPHPNRCPNVVFIMHTYYKTEDLVMNFSLTTFLSNVNVVVVSGHDTFTTYVRYAYDDVRTGTAEFSRTPERKLIKVDYNGNPGKDTRHAAGSYKGTHRTMMGLLIANDTFPDAEWYYVFDDDNYVFVNHICQNLNTDADSKVPVLLSGAIGPKAAGHAPCFDTSTHDHWSCCNNAKKACTANLESAHGRQSFFMWDEALQTMTARPCTDHRIQSQLVGTSCHQSVPWPEGMMYGYPYRLRHASDFIVDATPHHALLAPHSVLLYPYGGATYALSKAMMDAVGRDRWEHFAYGIQWANADIDVMTIVLNAGYSVTQFNGVGVPHHVKEIPQYIYVAFKHFSEEEEIKMMLCKLDSTNVAEQWCKDMCPDCPQFTQAGRALAAAAREQARLRAFNAKHDPGVARSKRSLRGNVSSF